MCNANVIITMRNSYELHIIIISFLNNASIRLLWWRLKIYTNLCDCAAATAAVLKFPWIHSNCECIFPLFGWSAFCTENQTMSSSARSSIVHNNNGETWRIKWKNKKTMQFIMYAVCRVFNNSGRRELGRGDAPTPRVNSDFGIELMAHASCSRN